MFLKLASFLIINAVWMANWGMIWINNGHGFLFALRAQPFFWSIGYYDKRDDGIGSRLDTKWMENIEVDSSKVYTHANHVHTWDVNTRLNPSTLYSYSARISSPFPWYQLPTSKAKPTQIQALLHLVIPKTEIKFFEPM